MIKSLLLLDDLMNMNFGAPVVIFVVDFMNSDYSNEQLTDWMTDWIAYWLSDMHIFRSFFVGRKIIIIRLNQIYFQKPPFCHNHQFFFCIILSCIDEPHVAIVFFLFYYMESWLSSNKFLSARNIQIQRNN